MLTLIQQLSTLIKDFMAAGNHGGYGNKLKGSS